MSHTPSSLLPLDASALYGELRSLQQTPEGSRDPERLAHLLGALDLLPAHVSEAHMRACVEDLLCTEFDHILTSHGWVRQEERIWHKTLPSGQTIETSYLGGLITSSRHLDTHHGYTDKWFARLGVTRGFDEFQSLVMSYRHDCEASYECEDDTYRGLGLDEALIAVEIKRRRRQIEAMLETLPDTQVHQARRADYLYALKDLLTQSEWDSAPDLLTGRHFAGSDHTLAVDGWGDERRYTIYLSRGGRLTDDCSNVYRSIDSFETVEEAHAFVTPYLTCAPLHVSYSKHWRFMCSGKRYAEWSSLMYF